jgi:hypothetical protein
MRNKEEDRDIKEKEKRRESGQGVSEKDRRKENTEKNKRMESYFTLG